MGGGPQNRLFCYRPGGTVLSPIISKYFDHGAHKDLTIFDHGAPKDLTIFDHGAPKDLTKGGVRYLTYHYYLHVENLIFN